MMQEISQLFAQDIPAGANDICARVEEKLDDIHACAETARRAAIFDEAIGLCMSAHSCTVARAPGVAAAFLDVAEWLTRSRADDRPDFYLAFAQIGLLRGAILKQARAAH